MSKIEILDHHGRPLKPSAYRGRSRGFYGTRFDGARTDTQATRGWTTRAAPASADSLSGRETVGARARDLVRNNGVARGSLRKSRAQTVGTGLRLRARPNARALGVDPQAALAFGRLMEREFDLWANGINKQCDIRRRMSFGGLQRLLWSDRMTAGECLAILRWKPDRRDVRYGTCVQAIDPDRLSNPNDRHDQDLLRQGVELSEDGEALGYHFRDAHEGDYVFGGSTFTWTHRPRFDDDGRRVVIHGFDDDRTEQVRGVSPFAPILVAFRNVGTMGEAEINAAIVNSLYAAFVTSSTSPDLLAEAMGLSDGPEIGGMLKAWGEARDEAYPDQFGIADQRFTFLAPGDEVQMNDTSRQTSPYASFKKSFLQDIAAALGIAYPVLAEDWEGVNYSSARMALAEVWRIVTEDRDAFIEDTIAPIYCEVMSEAFDRGYLTEPDGWPSFEDNKDAYLRSSWTGPGKGMVDPLKEAQAYELQMQMGIITYEQVCAILGYDWEDQLDQLEAEAAEFARRGLARPTLGDVLGHNGGPPLDPLDV